FQVALRVLRLDQVQYIDSARADLLPGLPLGSVIQGQ
ncbi:hypothetical protein Pgy4_40370, partial [Pseudomonas savastanoi pv. glycinea str. race 4]